MTTVRVAVWMFSEEISLPASMKNKSEVLNYCSVVNNMYSRTTIRKPFNDEYMEMC